MVIYGDEGDKLLFKILNSGDAFSGVQPEQLENSNALSLKVCEKGLRYDLTVPLVRFYSNNMSELPSPFKALQIGSVWRADRPQKGRFRQFYQCDIDILGEPGNLAEIELILATTTTLGRIGFKNFKIKINDRRILKAMAAYSGFAEAEYDNVFIILDKMDKIGIEGVKAELIEAGYPVEAVEKYVALFDGIYAAENGLTYVAETIKDYLDAEVREGLQEIIDSVEGTKTCDFDIVFDPTLVRGMSYYTGTIFEIEVPEFGSSVGGGGRYDKMVGKFTGQDTPACGFSIGFERIITILMDNNFEIPNNTNNIAFLIEKGIQSDVLCNIIQEAQKLRHNGYKVLVVRMNKNKKFQKDNLINQGYTEFKEFYKNPLK